MMEIVNTILILIGFSFTGWYISILQKQISSQKELLYNQSKFITDAKTLFEIFDLKKVKEFVAMREETIALQKNKEIAEIRASFKDTSENAKVILKEFMSLMDFTTDIIGATPVYFTEEAVKNIPDGTIVKESLKRIIDAISEKNQKTATGLMSPGAYEAILRNALMLNSPSPSPSPSEATDTTGDN